MQPAVGTLHPDSTVQDGHPTPTNQPVQLLTKEMLLRVVQSMAAISSVSTFEEFKDRYDQLSDAQQRQIWGAASPEARQTYQHWQEAFLAIPQSVWEARKALLGVVTVSDMNEIRQQFDRDVLSTALKLIHESAQKSLKRLLKVSKQEQP
jgi:hypothetical protein